MSRWHTSLAGRFAGFPKSQQLLMAVNELNRANNLRSNAQEYRNALERALELFDLCAMDRRWRPALRELRRGRELLAAAYLASPPASLDKLIKTFIQLDPDAWEMLY